jgi:hypothetical protein
MPPVTDAAVASRVIGFEAADAVLTLVDGSGVLLAEPGYAVMAGDRLACGADALADARRNPLAASTRHWRDFGLADAGGPARPAPAPELVGAHVARLAAAAGAAAGWVIAVPAGWQPAQAAALAALCAGQGLPVLGLVDAAVAVARAPHPGYTTLYVEAALHGLGLTRLAAGDEAAVAERECLPQPSVEGLQRVAAEFIARRFVETTRYDPLHSPASEQRLADALPGWLRRLQQEPTVGLVLDTAAGQFTATVAAADLRARVALATEGLLQRLRALAASRGPLALLVHHRLADFPGFVETLLRVPGARVVVLEPGAAARGALARLAALRAAGPAAGVVARLPFDLPPVESTGNDATGVLAGTRPTHLLYGHRAFRLDAVPFLLGVELAPGERGIALDPAARGVSRRHCTLRREGGALVVFDHSRFGTTLNGHRIQGSAVLEAGDVLTLGTPPVAFRLVAEEGADGAA